MSASAEGGDGSAYAEWRAAVERKLGGRRFDDALVSTVPGSVRVEPLSVAAEPPEPVLDLPRRERAAFGSVLADGEATPDGPTAGWWCGVPGAQAPATLRARVVEGESRHVPPATESVTTYFATAGGTPAAGSRFRACDGVTAHERGAAPATEIAAVLFAALEHARGVAPSELSETWCASTAVGPDVLIEIAKLRAMRAGLRGIADAFGARSPDVVARTSFRSTSRLDPETNAVRSALGATAALVGGADVVCCLPYDAAQTTRSARGAELAWATPAVLALESGLCADADMVAGSHTIEALTRALGRAAWDIVRELDADRTRAAARLDERIAADADERARLYATRGQTLVGTSRFVPSGAPAPRGDVRVLRGGLGPRDAAAFEALAQRGRGQSATLLALGDAVLEPRVAFAAEALELAGLRVERHGPFGELERALAAASASAPLAVVCTADAALGEGAVALVRALRAGGARAVLVAGRPRGAEATLRAAGASGFVHVGANVIEILTAALAEAAS